VGLLLKAAAVVVGLFNWLINRQQQRIGQLEQQASDLKATKKEASNAQKSAEEVARESDDQLNADLAKRMRGGGA